MNKLGLITLASLVIGLMVVMVSFGATTEESMGSNGSAGSPGISSGWSSGMEGEGGYSGMSSDQDLEHGLAPESRDEDFNTPSDEEMSPDRGGEFGMAPEFRGEDSNTRYGGEMSSGENRYHGSPYKVTPDKDPNAPY